MLIYEGKGKSKVLILFLLNFRQSGDVLFFPNVRRLRGYTATVTNAETEREIFQKQAHFACEGGFWSRLTFQGALPDS